MRLLLLAVLFSAFSASAQAAPCCRDRDINPPRWYAGFTGSLVFLSDYDVSAKNAPANFVSSTSAITFDPDLGVSGQVGYRLFSYLRAELELGHYISETDSITNVTNQSRGRGYNGQRTTTVMANLYGMYPNHTLFTPYVGGGMGMMYIRAPLFYEVGPTDPITGELTSVAERHDLKEWVLGYQLMTGVSYQVPSSMLALATPLEISLGYRYLTTAEDPETVFNYYPGLSYPFEHTSHHVDFGVRLWF